MVLHLSFFYYLQFSDCIPGCAVNGFTSEEREKKYIKYEHISIICCFVFCKINNFLKSLQVLRKLSKMYGIPFGKWKKHKPVVLNCLC